MAKVTVPEIRRKKERGEKITMLTAYDTPTARILDECGVDVLLAVSYTHLTLPTN